MFHSRLIKAPLPTKKNGSETSDVSQFASQAVCFRLWRRSAYVAGFDSEERGRQSEDVSSVGASFPSGTSHADVELLQLRLRHSVEAPVPGGVSQSVDEAATLRGEFLSNAHQYQSQLFRDDHALYAHDRLTSPNRYVPDGVNQSMQTFHF